MNNVLKLRGWDTKKKIMHSAYEMGQDQLTLSVDGRGFVNVNGQSTKLSTFLPHIIPMLYINIDDQEGTEIYKDDILLLDYAGITLKGRVQQLESGEWELYQDDDNHVGIAYNKGRIKVIGHIHQVQGETE